MQNSTVVVVSVVLFLILYPLGGVAYRKRGWIVSHVSCPPEILLLSTEAKRIQACTLAYRAFLRRPVTWMSILCYVAAGVFVPLWLRTPTIAWAIGLPIGAEAQKVVGISLLLIPMFCPTPLLFWQCRRWMRGFLRNYLNEQGIPICKTCGYDLQGSVSAACPECGGRHAQAG